MIRFALIFLIFLSAGAPAGLASERSDRLKGCQALTDCLTILDAAIPKADANPPLTAYWPYLPANPERDVKPLLGDEREIADTLQRFGESAKLELLLRAVGNHPGSRNLAGAILEHWHIWSPSDVPALRAALRLRHGGAIARPLGEIGTPDAIQALVDDLAESLSPASQTGYALEHSGARALPFLLPLLENEQQAWKAESVIRGMGAESLELAADWVSLAANPDRLKSARLAALRGLAAMGEGVQGEPIRTMLVDADSDLRDQAFKTLVRVHDPTVAAAVAEKCTPSASEFEWFSKSAFCIWDVAAFGDNGHAAGPSLMRFLESRNGTELATAVGALGYIGYGEAIPAILQLLNSRDWRVVLASVQSLGWLGAVQAIPDLERVGLSYWLLEVREAALAVLRGLKSSERKMAKPPSFAKANQAIGPFRKRHEYNCPSERWEWQGVSIQQPQSRNLGLHRFPLAGGTLTGTNRGEWGGELYWKKGEEEAQSLVKDNVRAIERAEGGAIVLFGLAHMGSNYGYAIYVSPRADGGWSLTEVARLPGVPEASTAMGPNLFAAWSDGRVIVFSSKEILGLAACAA